MKFLCRSDLKERAKNQRFSNATGFHIRQSSNYRSDISIRYGILLPATFSKTTKFITCSTLKLKHYEWQKHKRF